MRELRAIGEISEQFHLLFGVNSNGFWAKSNEQAKEVLKKIPGLTQLMLSTDIYHEAFIPLSNLQHAIVAGLQLNLTVQVAICTPAGAEDAFARRFRAFLGEDLIKQIGVGVNPIEAEGRAERLPEARWRAIQNEYPKGHCLLINRPVIMEDGRVSACCNTCVVSKCSSTPLWIGDFSRRPLNEILVSSETDNIVQALRSLGPSYLAQLLDRNGLGEGLPKLYRKDDICELCHCLMSKAHVVQALYKMLAAPEAQRDIAVGRAAVYGELDMLQRLRDGSDQDENIACRS